MYWAFAPYVAIAALYLACMRRESGLLRALKPLLMPSLLAGYLMLGDAQTLIALGLALGFAGDVALMLPRGRGLLAGMGAFMLGHLMYTAYFCVQLGGAPSPWTLAYALAAAGVGVGLYRHLRAALGGMKLPVLLYEAVILFMSVCAFALLIARPGAASALMWLGSVSFVVSDILLAHGLFIGSSRRGRFLVMLTYTAAQLGIAVGAWQMAAGAAL